MFYLYNCLTASEPIASFPTIAEAQAMGNRWLAGGGIIRTVPVWTAFLA